MSNAQIRQLREQYSKAVRAALAIREKYDGQPDQMSAEEAAQFDAYMEEADQLDAKIAEAEKALQREAWASQAAERLATVAGPLAQPDADGNQASVDAARVVDAYRKYLKGGFRALDHNDWEVVKALQADDDPHGGYLVAPEVWVNQLLKGLDDMVHIRRLATVYQLETAESLGVPTLDRDLEDADWTAEIKETRNDESIQFGKRQLRPHPLSKEVRLSRTLIRKSRIPAEQLVLDRMAYKFGITEEKAFIVGTGDGQPLGVMTPSNDGISTDRDVVTGSKTDVTADGLIDIVHALKPQYWPNAVWLVSREFIKRVRKLKDANDGQYLWQPGLQQNLPNRILEIPYVLSEYVPADFSDGNYVGMLGDFRFYWIVEALDFSVQTLEELYARTNQIGYIGRMEVDGMPVLEEAFIRIKCGDPD